MYYAKEVNTMSKESKPKRPKRKVGCSKHAPYSKAEASLKTIKDDESLIHRTIQYNIDSKHPLYTYFEDMTLAANNLKNATLFRLRQIFTFTGKEFKNYTANELEIYNETVKAAEMFPELCYVPTKEKRYPSYRYMDKLMRATENPNFFDDRLPSQSAQYIVKGVLKDMKSFRQSLKKYKTCPEVYTGKPNLPKYNKSGGKQTVTLSNEACSILIKDDGKYCIKMPKTETLLEIGDTPLDNRIFMEMKVKPYHDIFVLSLVFVVDEKPEPKKVPEKPQRICAIDLGVNNFAAITNNVGQPCLLFKGGTIKSKNQWYNKQMAKIKSKQTKGTPGESQKFIPTPESKLLGIQREMWMGDFMHKCAKMIVSWCINNNIDTIVVGENKGWKQEVNTGKTNNQNFVNIPFDKFKSYLEYLCEYNEIRLIRQEESYTSKASFLDNDIIPVYGETKDNPHFSGKRRPTKYTDEFGEHKNSKGFRGWYVSSNGTRINSDLNGSANIGRKCIPDMFTMDGAVMPDFNNAIVYKHPDEHGTKLARQKQLQQTQQNARKVKSTSNRKLKRLHKKKAISDEEYKQLKQINKQLKRNPEIG